MGLGPLRRVRGFTKVDPVDAEAVLFFERRPLASDTFDQVGKPCGLSVVAGEGKDVDFG